MIASTIHTLHASDDNAQRIQLPSMPHPSMQRRRESPDEHAAWHPCDHAISPAQRSTERLQGDKEGEEEGDGRVDVALLEPNISCEVRRLGIPYLQHPMSASTPGELWYIYIHSPCPGH